MASKHMQRVMREQVKNILNKRPADRRVAAVDGFLLAMMTAFGTHHREAGLDLSFQRISESCDDPRAVINKHMVEHEEARVVELQELDNWPDILRSNLVGCITPEELSQEGQNELLEAFIILLQAVCQGYVHGWRVIGDSADGSYFHCWCDIYALAAPDGLYLLYCSIDD
ncbi:MAG: hypothetical protein R3C45_03365 [Phycisphaerales bacterium]